MKQSRPELFLWKKRLIYDLSQKKRLLSMMFDWVVSLYLIIPTLLIGSIQYYHGLQSPPAWWNDGLVQVGLTLMLLFPIFFNVRPLFSLGDEGILIASPLSPRRFITYSWVQDMLTKLFLSLLMWGLLTPYLRLLNWTYIQIGGLFLLWYVMSLFVVQMEWIWIGRNRWFHKLGFLINMLLIIGIWALIIHSFIAKNFLVLLLTSALILLLGFLIFMRNHRYGWAWSLLIQESVEKRLGLIAFILEGGRTKSKVKLKNRRPARLLKGSLGLSFRPENALTLWYVKGFLRTFNRYSQFIQAFIYSMLAMLLIPIWWISAIVLGLALIMLANLLLAPTKNLESPWFQIYPFTFAQRSTGLAKGPRFLNSFVGVIGSIIVTLHIGKWFYIFPITFLAIVVAWGSVELSAMSKGKSV